MLYEEYEGLKEKFREAQERVDAILAEKEALFAKTQPGAIKYDKERVSGGPQENTFESYLTELERKQIDKRLAEAKALLQERKTLLDYKLEELRESRTLYDKIYRQRFVEGWRVYKISKTVNLSESQVYRIIKKIQASLKNARKC